VEYQPDIKQITGTGGLISAVEPGSIADDLGLAPGDILVAIGGQVLRDVIDYRFAVAESEIELLVRNTAGEETIYEIEKDPDEELGLQFSEPLFDRLRTCNNKCPFCFITQMPRKLRKTLYLKDDDYRLSFLYNNFVTFTNLTEADWERIERQRLSPMNISVHATDPAWRAIMLGKQDVPDVREQIRRLGRAGISVHTQVVACPEVNDGDVLQASIADLVGLYPTVQSISVVPVGLTRFRFEGKAPKSIRAAIQVHESPEWIDSNWERQPLWQEPPVPAQAGSAQHNDQAIHDPSLGFCSRLGATADVPLRCYSSAEAAAVLDLIEPVADRCRRDLGLSLVYPSDEFYLLAGRRLPPVEFYDDTPQYSNGVGMVSDFLAIWQRVRRRLPARVAQPERLALVCGTLMAPILTQVADRLNRIDGLQVLVTPIVNHFFGETVTVSGLLTAQDVIPVLQASGCNRAILPQVMFDYTGERTIDEYSPQQISDEAGMPVMLANDPEDLLRYLRRSARVAA
jgi:NifB/MoaA-like Fe-S oxidoreductase